MINYEQLLIYYTYVYIVCTPLRGECIFLVKHIKLNLGRQMEFSSREVFTLQGRLVFKTKTSRTIYIYK